MINSIFVKYESAAFQISEMMAYVGNYDTGKKLVLATITYHRVNEIM